MHDRIFDGECYDDAILRADLTADVRGIPVTSFGKAMWCKFKHTNQQEYGEFQHLTTAHNRFAAQTLYYGRKPKQVRFYDKTRHRRSLAVLLPGIHRLQRKRGEELSSFADVYGYDPSEIVTRAERQMGDRETASAWKVATFGQIPQLVKCDPWERLHFVDDAKVGKREIDGEHKIVIELMREKIEQGRPRQCACMGDGMLRKTQFFPKMVARKTNNLIIDLSPLISRETLTKHYRESLELQLAA